MYKCIELFTLIMTWKFSMHLNLSISTKRMPISSFEKLNALLHPCRIAFLQISICISEQKEQWQVDNIKRKKDVLTFTHAVWIQLQSKFSNILLLWLLNNWVNQVGWMPVCFLITCVEKKMMHKALSGLPSLMVLRSQERHPNVQWKLWMKDMSGIWLEDKLA